MFRSPRILTLTLIFMIAAVTHVSARSCLIVHCNRRTFQKNIVCLGCQTEQDVFAQCRLCEKWVCWFKCFDKTDNKCHTKQSHKTLKNRLKKTKSFWSRAGTYPDGECFGPGQELTKAQLGRLESECLKYRPFVQPRQDGIQDTVQMYNSLARGMDALEKRMKGFNESSTLKTLTIVQ